LIKFLLKFYLFCVLVLPCFTFADDPSAETPNDSIQVHKINIPCDESPEAKSCFEITSVEFEATPEKKSIVKRMLERFKRGKKSKDIDLLVASPREEADPDFQKYSREVTEALSSEELVELEKLEHKLKRKHTIRKWTLSLITGLSSGFSVRYGVLLADGALIEAANVAGLFAGVYSFNIQYFYNIYKKFLTFDGPLSKLFAKASERTKSWIKKSEGWTRYYWSEIPFLGGVQYFLHEFGMRAHVSFNEEAINILINSGIGTLTQGVWDQAVAHNQDNMEAKFPHKKKFYERKAFVTRGLIAILSNGLIVANLNSVPYADYSIYALSAAGITYSLSVSGFSFKKLISSFRKKALGSKNCESHLNNK